MPLIMKGGFFLLSLPFRLLLCSAGTSNCNENCFTCQGAAIGQCMSCATNAVLTSPAPASCICSPGAFSTSDAQHCTLCNSLCVTCSGTPTYCLSCQANASQVGGVCTCNAGFYPNPTALSCAACDVNCLTCTGAGPNVCASCYANAVLGLVTPFTCNCVVTHSPFPDAAHCLALTACAPSCFTCGAALNANACTGCYSNTILVSPGSCVCRSNAAPMPDVANCQLCDSSCQTCSIGGNALMCTTCYGAAVLTGTSPSSCICPAGLAPSPDVTNCQTCHSSCKNCSIAGDGSKCTDCYDMAALSGSSPNSCVCPDGTFPNPDVTKCAQCDSSCQLCVAVGTAGCSKCLSGAFLAGPPPSSCQCSPGFYASPDASNCLPCLNTCQTCLDALECQSCYSHASLLTGQCQCNSGTFPSPDASLCLQCPTGCQICISTSCLQCSSPYILHQGACVLACPQAYESKEGICMPANSTPPVPSLEVDLDNDLYISFDKDMALNLVASDIHIEITVGNIVYNLTWSIPIVESKRLFYVILRINATSLPAENRVKFEFLHPESVLDSASVPIATSILYGVLYPFGDSQSSNSSTFTQAATIIGSATVTTALIGASLSGSSSSLWSMLNQLQIITYIPMTAIPIPSGLVKVLNALTIDSFVPNLFGYINDDRDGCAAPPHFSRNYGLDTSTFLTNAGVMLGAAASMVSFFLLAYLLSRLKLPLLENYTERLFSSFRWKVPLRWLLQSYLDLLVFAGVQLYTNRDSACLQSPYQAFNSLLALIGFIGTCVTPLCLFVFFRTYRKEIATRFNPFFNQRWDELYRPFLPNDYVSSFYYLLFVLRRFFYGLTILLLSAYPKTQALISTSLTLAVLVYVVVCRAFVGKMDWLCEGVLEMCTFAVFILSSFYVFDPPKEVKDTVEVIAIWTVLGSILFCALLSAVKMAMAGWDVVRKYRQMQHSLQISLSSKPLGETSIRTVAPTPTLTSQKSHS